MRRRHPCQKYGDGIFGQAQRPVAEGLGTDVGRGACGCLGAVRGERDAAGQQRCRDTPLLGDSAREGAIGQKGGGGRPDEGVNRVPDTVDVRNLVGDELDDEQHEGESHDDGVREHFELCRQVDDTEALEQSCGGDRGVEIESRSEGRAEREAEGLERGHGLKVNGER